MITAKSKWLNGAIILALVISLIPFYAATALGAATGAPAVPQVSHDNWDNDGSYTISWNMWSGNNATSWALLENNVEMPGIGGPLTDNTPGGQSGSVKLQGKKLGQYTYAVKLTNSFGTTLSAPITVNVGKKGPLPSPAPVGPMPNKNIVVYFPEWGIYGAHNNYTMDKIPWDKVTHVNYAFAKPLADGTIAGFDCWAAMKESQGCENKDGAYDGNFADLQYAKAKYPRVKILISIGGWTLSGTFSDIAADPVKRNRFADSSVAFMKKFGFDGIDIDWEYPGQPGDPYTNNKYRPEDKQNFNLLLAKVREKLDAASAADNRTGNDKYLLTIAAPAGYTAIETSEPGVYHQYLDFINLMTYDYRGAFDRVTGHHSPVYPSEDGKEKERFNADYTANLYHSLGVPKHKLNIGTPYYSRGWGLVDPNTGVNGMYANSGETYNVGPCGIWDDPNSQHNQCGGQNPYYHIKNAMEKDPAFTKYRDPVNQTPWLYSPSKREVYTYEDEVSIAFKADYVNNSGWGGMIAWEITGDSPASGGTALTDMMYQKFTQPTAPDTEPPTAPSGLAVTGQTSASVSLSWAASTDNVGVTGYEVYANGAAAPSTTTTGATSATVIGLAPNTTYSFTVKARDAAGNVSAASGAVSATTAADVPDAEPPTAPSGLTVTGKTSTSVSLAWTASADNVGVAAYDVYRDGALAGTTTSTAYTASGLAPGTTYVFTVKARDAAGNVSADSNALSVTTDTVSTPEWQANTSYTAGDVVMYNNMQYKCRQSHTSLPGWEPPNVPALWQLQP
ncbi:MULTISPECIES: glycosyl hydrolase family 18 protein [unclassified Paenibacillus]|uniref:glycosyl hydrolase family 18 protein n=1 Tax=unclassified Paenibacillus TaxID=185978 RepID=UPI001C12370C|nr:MULTISPECIES: glycosyl hydrolase family 18 protein [unclassified Paenibacillus]MBU5441083.1 fibronectin type III domain-containing protein [Paenibacillus sp. MSJ-34]CAH0119725.1 Chitinase A1 [Paenibacillus sp. CECT 9249]